MASVIRSGSPHVFGDLRDLHGDKAVWKLADSGRYRGRRVAVDGTVPIDVDTWDDYRRCWQSVAR